jgi:hypothetical protein
LRPVARPSTWTRQRVTGCCYRWLAVCLALLGQVTTTFGLPAPVPAAVRASEPKPPETTCSCPESERAVRRCCCAVPEAPSLPPCCAAEAATEKAQAEPPKPSKKSSLKFTWVGGVLMKRCFGPLDEALGLGTALAAPPGPPVTWNYEWTCCGWVVTAISNIPTHSTGPLTPPPRKS